MPSSTTHIFTVVILISAVAVMGLAETSLFAASPLYYCQDRKGDRQYSATRAPGCVPLVEEKERDRNGHVDDNRLRDFKVENLQQEVTAFLTKYRRFLDCCKMDLTELQQVEELGDEVGELLALTQANLSNYSLASRGIMLREMISPVARARADLKTLRTRLEEINERSNRRKTLDFEEAGREANAIREMEESIQRDIHIPDLPVSAKTGTEIGIAPAVGPGIGQSPKTGTEIGRGGLTGQDIGTSPRSSTDIGSSGPTGFEIGATGRAGEAIGDSSLNQDTSSSVSSTLERSTIGSSISDSSIGSSPGSSDLNSNSSPQSR